MSADDGSPIGSHDVPVEVQFCLTPLWSRNIGSTRSAEGGADRMTSR
jgi:hypothetical protein